MPELPEVELVVSEINRDVAGRVIAGGEVLWPGYVVGVEPPDQIGRLLCGERLVEARRRGKFILISLERHAVLNHLRMTGRISQLRDGEEPPWHTHVIFDLEGGGRLAFSDVRKFGRLEVFPLESAEERIEALGLGLEPLERSFNSRSLAKILAGRSRSIKSVLLDQKLIAGIGNIYASEILFGARIDPFRPAGSLVGEEVSRVAGATRKVLGKAIERGGSTISDYVRPGGGTGEMQEEFRVYGRAGEACPACSGELIREIQLGRSTFWCPNCQK